VSIDARTEKTVLQDDSNFDIMTCIVKLRLSTSGFSRMLKNSAAAIKENKQNGLVQTSDKKN
jgi:hypothetical protein